MRVRMFAVIGWVVPALGVLSGGWAAEGEAPKDRPAKAAAKPAEGQQTLAGTFYWSSKRNQRPEMTVVLTPKGPGEWDAQFTPQWNNKGLNFTGAMQGSLDNGKVTGTAKNGNRSWRFEGAAQNGQIICKHYETTGGKEQFTGEFTVRKRV